MAFLKGLFSSAGKAASKAGGFAIPPTNMNPIAYGSTSNVVKKLNKQVLKANSDANGSAVVNFVKNVDANFGGHGQALGSQAKEYAKGTKLGNALFPGEGELSAQVKRQIGVPGSNVNKGELQSALHAHNRLTDEYIAASGSYENALKSAGYDLNNANVQAKMKGTFKYGNDDVEFDFSNFGTDKETISQNLKGYGAKLSKQKEMIGEQMANADKGFVMTDQNALEKAQTYFSNAEHGKTRMIAAGVGTAGLLVGGRLVSGGSLTRNADGERDIAGIPFI